MRNFIDGVEEKIEVFFGWLNKEPESKIENLLLLAVGLGLFIGLFISMGLVGTLFI